MSSIADALTAFFWPAASAKKTQAPEGVCGNCWGHYEYDGEIRQAVADRQINVNNKQERYAFIQEFAVRHVDGITLRTSPQGPRCPRCDRVHN